MSGEPVLTVSQLTAAVRDLLEDGIGRVRVEGEISNFRRQSSGHLYFTLKDAEAQLQAVQFRGDAVRLGFAPEDGQQVVAEGQITVYAPRGQYQMRVQTLSLRGRGNLQQQFEELKARLRAEGLFEESRKRPLPLFPRRIGLVTSPTGAALRDFLNVLGRRCPRLEIVLAGVRVQGREAAPEIAAALARLNREPGIDLIVLTRGGGSLEDLWPFNEEIVARAIAASAVPVVSGVGHEIDFTIADFAADLRAPTPSAAAEMLCLSDSEWRQRLDRLGAVIGERVRAEIGQNALQLDRYRDHYVFREPVRVVEHYQQRVDDMGGRMERMLEEGRTGAGRRLAECEAAFRRLHPGRALAETRKHLEQAGARLQALSPQATLERGYAIVFDPAGQPIRRVAAARQAGSLHIQVADGTFVAVPN